MLSKEREIIISIYNKRLNKIDELSKKSYYGDLIFFFFHSSGLKANFSALKDPVAFLKVLENVKYW